MKEVTPKGDWKSQPLVVGNSAVEVMLHGLDAVWECAASKGRETIKDLAHEEASELKGYGNDVVVEMSEEVWNLRNHIDQMIHDLNILQSIVDKAEGVPVTRYEYGYSKEEVLKDVEGGPDGVLPQIPYRYMDGRMELYYRGEWEDASTIDLDFVD